MTQLDDVLSITESKDWEGGVVDVQVLKEQIKALMLELVGEYEETHMLEPSDPQRIRGTIRNALRAELRSKIEAL